MQQRQVIQVGALNPSTVNLAQFLQQRYDLPIVRAAQKDAAKDQILIRDHKGALGSSVWIDIDYNAGAVFVRFDKNAAPRRTTGINKLMTRIQRNLRVPQ
jgi:hypothetical protein